MSGGPEHHDENARLLAYLAAGCALLLIVTVILIVAGHAFGFASNPPDATIVGQMLIWAAGALGLLPVAYLLRRWGP